jgi:glycine/D-amino acid oxidase-like deaminating enzyme/nitrite reductase/ring-hydroxylating ferredoxin subunit
MAIREGTADRRQLDTTPYWTEAALPSFPAVDRSQHVDVIVVGGGITGLTSAYLLAAAGRTVMLLERGRCAQVDTGHTSGHLTMVTDARLGELATRFGRTHAQAVWDAGLAAIAQIDGIIRAHDIRCGFQWVDGYLHGTRLGTEGGETFRDEAALARELGFDAEFVADAPVVGGAAIRFTGQARFHPRQYLAGLARAVDAAEGNIHEHSEAAEFSTDPRSVRVNGFTITCDDIILATHNPLVGTGSTLAATLAQTRLALYTSYVVAGQVAKGVVPDALWWDTGDPYRYLRVEPCRDHDLLIYGGEDHKTGQSADPLAGFARLEADLAAMAPGVAITHRWSGQVIETPDGLPIIGPGADHQYAATGFAGNGLTFGTLGAMIMTDAVLGRPNPWAELFEPGRGAVRKGLWEYIKENADYPYYMIRDRFAGAESRSLRSVRRGQGMIVERGGRKAAVYRHANGETTIRSAICTHMGCVVGWNEADRTWDCPCHGSRFKPNGDVISGPAETPLPALDASEE